MLGVFDALLTLAKSLLSLLFVCAMSMAHEVLGRNRFEWDGYKDLDRGAGGNSVQTKAISP